MTKMPSENFMRALELSTSAGGCRMTCEFCDREHYASTAGYDFDEGEIEALEAMPNSVDHGDCSVTYGMLDGKQYVVDCECGKAQHFEKWITAHRRLIVEFLKLRAEEIAAKAKAETNLVERLPAELG